MGRRREGSTYVLTSFGRESPAASGWAASANENVRKPSCPTPVVVFSPSKATLGSEPFIANSRAFVRVPLSNFEPQIPYWDEGPPVIDPQKGPIVGTTRIGAQGPG